MFPAALVAQQGCGAVLALVLLPLLDSAGMHPHCLGNVMFTPAFFDQQHRPTTCFHLLFLA